MAQIPMVPLPMDNTLQGLDVVGLQEALTQRLQEELAARSQSATNEATQAAQQYQQAAAAPPPNLSPLQQFLPTLFGNIASVISEDPGFRERAQTGIAQQKKDLFDQRADNIQALKDVWSKRAAAAEDAGDLELETKAKIEIEKFSKLQQDMLDRKKHVDAMALQELKGQQELAQAKARGLGGGGGIQSKILQDSDPQAIAQGIMEGRIHPDTAKLGRVVGPVVAGILAREGFDQSKQLQNYNATARHLATKNGRLQLQIRQSAATVMQGLDDVEELANQLAELAPQTGVTPLNKMIVKGTREWGMLSPEAQNVATELNGQVATLIPELSNIYSAGGVPTDRAMKLAEQVVNAEWPLNRIKAGLNRERANLRYRVNAINQVGPALEEGAFDPGAVEAPEAPKAAKSGKVRVVGPKGQTGIANAGAKLPKGWKVVE